MTEPPKLRALPALVAPVQTFLCSRHEHAPGLVECVERLLYEEPPAMVAVLEWWGFCRKGRLRGIIRDDLAVLVWYVEAKP